MTLTNALYRAARLSAECARSAPATSPGGSRTMWLAERSRRSGAGFGDSTN